jgi:hypothetical protein
MLNGLPGGGSVTAWVANSLPLGSDGRQFLIGAALYTHGNVWGIADPPEDWKIVAQNTPAPGRARNLVPASAQLLKVNKKSWPYNLFPGSDSAHPGRK